MTSIDEVHISKLADKIKDLSADLLNQSQALAGTALYLETLSHKFEIVAKDIKKILSTPENIVDLPLHLL